MFRREHRSSSAMLLERSMPPRREGTNTGGDEEEGKQHEVKSREVWSLLHTNLHA